LSGCCIIQIYQGFIVPNSPFQYGKIGSALHI